MFGLAAVHTGSESNRCTWRNGHRMISPSGPANARRRGVLGHAAQTSCRLARVRKRITSAWGQPQAFSQPDGNLKVQLRRNNADYPRSEMDSAFSTLAGWKQR